MEGRQYKGNINNEFEIGRLLIKTVIYFLKFLKIDFDSLISI
jgi:hypothetical protein